MKVRTYLAVAGAAGLLGLGAFVVPATAGTAWMTHTLKFTSVTKDTLIISKTTVAEQDTDVNKSGKVIGFDMVYLTVNPKTGKGKGTFSFVTRGGFIYGAFRLTKTGAAGTITGGTGRYAGAMGTIVAKTLTKTRTAVTLKYWT
jgi:hypothetical protein